MIASGPLDHTELRAVHACLETGDLAEAQRRLAQLGGAPYPAAGLSYLATRLLFLRKRLDSRSVAERMEELLRDHPNFQEARTLLTELQPALAGAPSLPFAPAASSASSATPNRANLSSPPSQPKPASAPRVPSIAPQGVPGSKFPTFRPPEWPPRDLAALGAEDEHDRPTAVPEQTGFDARQIVVDTRGAQLTQAREAPTSWPAPRARRDGSYAIGREGSNPPSTHSQPPTVPSRASIPPDGNAEPVRPRPSVIPPVLRLSGEGSHTYARPDARLPMAQAPEDRLLFSSAPPLSPVRSSTIPPTQRPLDDLLAAGELWPELEQQVVRGDRQPAITYFEESARHQVSHLPSSVPEREQELLANLAAELLNKSWLTHHFAPFDLSLQSLGRLQAAIATLYGNEPRERPASALLLLLGSYVGESLRSAHRGSWRQNGGSPLLSTVRAGSSEWAPFELVRSWLQSGGRRSLTTELASTIARPGSLAWQSRGAIKITPHVLWQGDVAVELLPGLARAVGDSVWSTCTALLANQALDSSLESLGAADWLLQLLVDSAQPLRGDEPWLQRLALLFGSYAGEVYRLHAPAVWLDSEEPGLERFLLQLGTGLMVSPMGLVVASTVARRAGALDNWVRALIADPRRKPG